MISLRRMVRLTISRVMTEANSCIGFLNGGKYPYKDNSGFNLDNQALVFQVQLPKSADPA